VVDGDTIVVADASRLIVVGHVTGAPNDKQQPQPVLAAVSPVVGKVGIVLVDSGYYSAAAVPRPKRAAAVRKFSPPPAGKSGQGTL
jgi:hypothetical protein